MYVCATNTTLVWEYLWKHESEHKKEQEQWLLITTGRAHFVMKERICIYSICKEGFDKSLNIYYCLKGFCCSNPAFLPKWFLCPTATES